jgi:alpha-ketoglutarate-dependent taurine dioxygenase
MTQSHNLYVSPVPATSPFSLADDGPYLAWREQKLARIPADAESLLVPIENPLQMSAQEKAAIESNCRNFNMAIYRVSFSAQAEDKQLVHALGLQLGLRRLDNNLRADEDDITSLRVVDQQGNAYIPYTSRPLSWHTDGYYNRLENQVRGIIMYCVRPAVEGGVNGLLDPELVYIRLRDQNLDYIRALMQPQAMTIPPNVEQGHQIRGARSGPVFSVDPQTETLHMRYSARKRNIEWFDDELTRDAAALITEILADEASVISYQLQAGEGIVCNNVLHNRTGFRDDENLSRLLYRARYYDRVANTGLNEAEQGVSDAHTE